MNPDTSHPEGGPEGLPFFAATPSPYQYRVTYLYKNKQLTLLYNNVQEVILNLYSFQDTDTVTYITRYDGEDFMTRTIGQFKVMIAESLYGASREELENIYFRLVLANHYSRNISDKGRLKSYHYSLRKYVNTVRGGVDWYLMLEHGRTKLYLKLRRASLLYLSSFVVDASFQHDIHFYHINVPRNLSKQGLLPEALNLFLGKSNYRLYYYDPIAGAENDVLVPTDFSREIIAVINKLIQ